MPSSVTVKLRLVKIKQLFLIKNSLGTYNIKDDILKPKISYSFGFGFLFNYNNFRNKIDPPSVKNDTPGPGAY